MSLCSKCGLLGGGGYEEKEEEKRPFSRDIILWILGGPLCIIGYTTRTEGGVIRIYGTHPAAGPNAIRSLAVASRLRALPRVGGTTSSVHVHTHIWLQKINNNNNTENKNSTTVLRSYTCVHDKLRGKPRVQRCDLYIFTTGRRIYVRTA